MHTHIEPMLSLTTEIEPEEIQSDTEAFDGRFFPIADSRRLKANLIPLNPINQIETKKLPATNGRALGRLSCPTHAGYSRSIFAG